MISEAGKKYIAEQFGAKVGTKQCWVYSGLSWRQYAIDGTFVDETGGTGKVVSRVIGAVTDRIELKTPRIGTYRKSDLTTANAGEVTLIDVRDTILKNDGYPAGETQYCVEAAPPPIPPVTPPVAPPVTPPAPPITPTTCNQSFRIIEKDTNNPISGAKVTVGTKTCLTGASGECTITGLTKGKSYGWYYNKSGYIPIGYTFPFIACVTKMTAMLVPPVPPPVTPPVTPPEVAKFGLSEVIENRLPDWIEGYVCTPSGAAAYKCPTGYKLTRRSFVSLYGGHGCPQTAMVFRVKCEREAPPVTPPVTPPTTISSWIDETGVTNLTKNHAVYVFYVSAGAVSAADGKYAKLSPKPSRLDPSAASKDNAIGIFYYSQGAMAAGNGKTGCNY